MGKSGDLYSKYDALIDEVISDPLFKITRSGKIYSKVTENGQGVQDTWRQVGYKKKDGYVRFRYKGGFLFVHRVVFRKYIGPLKKDMTINHKNKDNSDNRVVNLEQIDMQTQNEHKWRKSNMNQKIAQIVNVYKDNLKKETRINIELPKDSTASFLNDNIFIIDCYLEDMLLTVDFIRSYSHHRYTFSFKNITEFDFFKNNISKNNENKNLILLQKFLSRSNSFLNTEKKNIIDSILKPKYETLLSLKYLGQKEH